MTVSATGGTGTGWFPTHLDHLEAELRLLDLAIVRAVAAMRRSPPAGTGQHVYISHEEVDRLLDPQVPAARGDRDPDGRVDRLRAEIDAAAARSREHGVDLPLARLAARLGLSRFEVHALVTCLAPELDRKYDRLYAYLQDDIARKRPSVDLAISLHARPAPEGWKALRSFSAQAPLRRWGILRVIDDPYSPSGSTALSQFLQITPRFLAHFLGDRQLDPVLAGLGRRVAARPGPAPADPAGIIERRLAALVGRRAEHGDGALIVHVAGDYGAGHGELVHAVAARLGTELVEFDAGAAPLRRPELDQMVEAVLREGWLTDTPVLFAEADRVLAPAEDEGMLRFLGPLLARYPCPVFLTARRRWTWPGAAGRVAVHEVVLPPPDVEVRRTAWRTALTGSGLTLSPQWLDELVERFRLTPGQVHDAVAEMRGAATAMDGPSPLADWYAACRRQTGRRLGELAQKLQSPHRWDDLVLEEDRLDQLRELCNQVRQRERVLGEWGFAERVAAGRGLAALFAGPPGTGKTMAAGVIANQLGLDLYRIDLSQVVSKYIGETEKNLSRIFTEAENSNAVLFFDEADALFAKRTQIGDAHDRYANIETSYLLQRMEEYGGIAIMASNLRQNMDEAFLRRLRFVVEFPFPDAAHRLGIWRRHLPAGAPLDDDLDLERLAERIPVSGGGIRSIVLAAAFIAAGEGRPIAMAHMLRAARREYDKLGKLWREIPPRRSPAGAGS
ncbi:ATP-binding protein [Thermomonospora amylolytica]|uniref:ATP-binding protein n=1 Tax=Thermomonospora amylolytica TaxID=1411117 RepID=UPI000E6C11FE|nr:ATP-binding protein [Thermomonospora amylolytica]